jgi:hypothetical protein
MVRGEAALVPVVVFQLCFILAHPILSIAPTLGCASMASLKMNLWLASLDWSKNTRSLQVRRGHEAEVINEITDGRNSDLAALKFILSRCSDQA